MTPAKQYTVVAGMHVSFHRRWIVIVQPNSKQTWCLTSTETTRLIRDGEKGGGGGKGDMEVGEEGDYIPIATLSPPE